MTPIKDALTYGLEAIRESYSKQGTTDDLYLADARYRAIEEALATLTTPAQGRDELRERIGRIIDPEAFACLLCGEAVPTIEQFDRMKCARLKADTILSALPVALVVDEPTSPMIDAGVAFALNVSLSGEYRWSQYVADLYKTMRKAAIRAGGGER